jgi:hypothetical protein
MIKLDRNMSELEKIVYENMLTLVHLLVLLCQFFINARELLYLNITCLYSRIATCFDRKRSSGHQKMFKNIQGKIIICMV